MIDIWQSAAARRGAATRKAVAAARGEEPRCSRCGGPRTGSGSWCAGCRATYMLGRRSAGEDLPWAAEGDAVLQPADVPEEVASGCKIPHETAAPIAASEEDDMSRTSALAAVAEAIGEDVKEAELAEAARETRAAAATLPASDADSEAAPGAAAEITPAEFLVYRLSQLRLRLAGDQREPKELRAPAVAEVTEPSARRFFAVLNRQIDRLEQVALPMAAEHHAIVAACALRRDINEPS